MEKRKHSRISEVGERPAVDFRERMFRIRGTFRRREERRIAVEINLDMRSLRQLVFGRDGVD